MSPDQITQWVNVVQLLVTMGVNVVSSLKGLISSAHPALSPADVNAAYVAILTDDALREMFARQAAAGASVFVPPSTPQVIART